MSQREVAAIFGQTGRTDGASDARDPAFAGRGALQEAGIGAPFGIAVDAPPIKDRAGEDAEQLEGVAADTPAEVGAIAHDAAPVPAQRIARAGIGKERVGDRRTVKPGDPGLRFGLGTVAECSKEVVDLEGCRRSAELELDAIARSFASVDPSYHGQSGVVVRGLREAIDLS